MTSTPDPLDDHGWMMRAIDLARLCPPAQGAYSVGAVIVDADGREITTGYSRETDPRVHAEESALAKLGAHRGGALAGATIYSTLEPCSQRSASRTPCARLVINSGIRRVVIAWREPSLFVADCQGVEQLTEAGVDVIELTELRERARAVNAHLALDD